MEAKIRRLIVSLKRWVENNASKIDQKEIIRDVYKEVEISPGYFTTLTLANLIVLIGLMQNNSSVIIGAMLISPLIVPILSFGFAVITGRLLHLEEVS